MKRSKILPATRDLTTSERAWLCLAILYHIANGQRLPIYQRTVAIKDEAANPVTDWLFARGDGAVGTEAAQRVLDSYIRLRDEWKTGVWDGRGKFRGSEPVGRKDWRHARDICLAMIVDLCPEAGEVLMAAEEEAAKIQPMQVRSEPASSR